MKKVGQFLGNSAKLYGDTYLSGVGLGNVIGDKAYKGDNAENWATASNITGGIAKTIAPIALGALGVPPSITMAGQTALGASPLNQNIKKLNQPEMPKPEGQKPPLPSFAEETTYRAYKHGGSPDGDNHLILGESVLVNVEKGELEVDPVTGEIVQHFDKVPKHPKGEDVVNLKGNVYMKKTNVIIPAKHKDKYLNAKKDERISIIKEVVEKAKLSDKKQTGGFGYNPSDPLGTNKGQYLGGGTPSATGKNVGSAFTETEKTNDPYSLGAGAAALPASVMGGYQLYAVNKGLKALGEKPLPKYEITPEQISARKRAGESYSRAEGMALGGFTPQEKAAYDEKLARANNTTLYNLRNQAGGQMNKVASAALSSQNLTALLDFAKSDAALHRDNIRYADRIGQYLDQTGTAITNQRNQQTQLDAQRRLMQEQALGTAKSQGMTNLTNASGQILGSLATNNSSLFG